MKIAILGWGSVVWEPLSLKKQLEDGGNFEQGGPKLPLEFSRISQDGRLTLVIDEKNGVMLPTRIATSKRLDLGEAVTDLWIREGRLEDSPDVRTSAKEKNEADGRIGYTDLRGENASFHLHPNHEFAHKLIMPWLQNSDFEAVVWTALPSNYKDFSVENAVNYLEKLPEKPLPNKASREDAFEYIRKAPPEVQTPLRKLLGELAKSTVSATEPAPAQSETFTSVETEELKTQLEAELGRAAHWRRVNGAWDLTFKVVLLILGVVSATDAGLIATIWKTGSPPRWAIISNIIFGVLITALAGFATAQVNFSARTEIYRKKETALQMMIDVLKYLKPEKAVFFRALEEIYSWNDYTPATVQMPTMVFPGLDDKRHNHSSK